jgi:endonuclease/exonuclease/phosphatase family metal-dependent hydrolase
MATITVMSQNAQYGARAQGRWPRLAEVLRAIRPTILLQEVDESADPGQASKAAAELGMRLELTPSRNLPTAVAWDGGVLEELAGGWRPKYSRELQHGYCGPRFRVPGLDEPLAVISTHLTPYSAQGAAIEAQMLISRAYRHDGPPSWQSRRCRCGG